MSIAEKLLTIAENEQRVYDAGREAEKQDFWNEYQNTHNPTYCKYQFAGKGWNYNTFYPKYDITPKVAQSMFQEFGGDAIFSLTERLNECKVTFDTSQCTAFHYIFYGTPFTEVPHIDTTNSTSLQNVYASSNQLIKASMSIKEDGSQTWTSCFTSCSKLADFTITSGAIGKNGFDIHWSTKLSKASILSILNACNIDVTSSPVTVTLPSKCIDDATDTEALLSETGDTDLYNAQMSARSLGYNIAFN